MRKFFILTICLVAIVVGAHLSVADDDPVGYAPASYQPTFDDEFSGIAIANGTAYAQTGTSFNTNLWDYRQLGVRRSAVNVQNAVSLANGNLAITTYSVSGTNYTGMVSTEQSFLQNYGYFETRMSVAFSPGEWSAFWLQSPKVGNPIGNTSIAGTEIDVYEDFPNNADSALNWDGYGSSAGTSAIHYGPQPDTSYHTYGLLWTRTGYTFYKDGVVTWKTNQAISRAAEYFILSSEVYSESTSGTIPANGYGSLTSSTTITLFDYVRAFAPPTPVSVPVDDPFESGTGSWFPVSSGSAASLTTIADPSSPSTDAANAAIGSGSALQVSSGGNTFVEAGRVFPNTTLTVGETLQLTFTLRYLANPDTNSGGFRVAIGNSNSANNQNGLGYVIEQPTGSAGKAELYSDGGTVLDFGNGSDLTLLASSTNVNLVISGTSMHTVELDVTYKGVVNGNNSYTFGYTLDNGTSTFTTSDASFNYAQPFNLLAIGNGSIAQNFLIDNVHLQVLPPPLTASAGTNSTISSYSTTLNGSISGTATGETWTLLSGSGSVSFGNSTSPTSTITFSAPGTYLLALSATNAQSTANASGYVTITVNPTPIEAWRMNTFGANDYADSAISGDTATPSENGVTNLMSYALGLNPFSNSSVANLPAASISGSNMILTYQQNDAATDITYTVEQSTNLQTWTTVAAVPTRISDNGTISVMQVIVPMSGQPTLMLHLKVTVN